MESLDGHPMQTSATPGGDGVRIVLTIALLAACAVNILLFWAWL